MQRYYLAFELRDMTEIKHSKKVLIFFFDQTGNLTASIFVKHISLQRRYREIASVDRIEDKEWNIQLLQAAYYRKIFAIYDRIHLINADSKWFLTLGMTKHLKGRSIAVSPVGNMINLVIAVVIFVLPIHYKTNEATVVVKVCMMLNIAINGHQIYRYYDSNLRI